MHIHSIDQSWQDQDTSDNTGWLQHHYHHTGDLEIQVNYMINFDRLKFTIHIFFNRFHILTAWGKIDQPHFF